jgi:hypothetical protein
MFGIQMYHEEMQVKVEYECGSIIIGEGIGYCPLDLENILKMTVSVHLFSDSLMDSNDIWYTDVS